MTLPVVSSMNFTLIAIGSAVFGAIANILARTLLKELRSKEILGINFLTMGATLVLFSPFFYYFKATTVAILVLIGIGVIDTLANFYYFKTFEETEASVASPMLALAPAFTFFFGWLLLDDTVNLKTVALAFLIMFLVVIFSAGSSEFGRFKKATLVPAIISSVLFGISAIPTKYLLTNLHVINAPTLYMYRAGLIALFSLVFLNFPLRRITNTQYRVIFFRGLFVIAQWLLLYYALTVGSAGVTITLANLTPIFVFLLSAAWLKEKITVRKIIASILILALSLII